MTQTFIVVCQQVYCFDGGPFEIAYNWDGARFGSRASAIRHGFEIRGSDDFNIAVCEESKIVSFDWMDKPVGATDADRREECQIAQEKVFGTEAKI